MRYAIFCIMNDSVENGNNLVKLFGSTSRARILALLFGRLHRVLYQREIMVEIGLSLQAVQRELSNLVELGIVTRYEDSNRVYYQINRMSPFFKPLLEMYGKAPANSQSPVPETL
jgi:predicted transcriptional regulator